MYGDSEAQAKRCKSAITVKVPVSPEPPDRSLSNSSSEAVPFMVVGCRLDKARGDRPSYIHPPDNTDES